MDHLTVRNHVSHYAVDIGASSTYYIMSISPTIIDPARCANNLDIYRHSQRDWL